MDNRSFISRIMDTECTGLNAPNTWMIVIKVKSPCLTNRALCHGYVCGSGHVDPCFLDLGTSWRWVVVFMLQAFNPRGKFPQNSLDRLGATYSQSGQQGEGKILVPIGTLFPILRSSSL
jgi:hypothetical protein